MMARAFVDPVFQADWAANDRLYACLYCHTPVATQREEVVTHLDSLRPIHGAGYANPSFDPSLQAEGVTCVSCHLRDGALAGPHDVQAPHATVQDADFGSAE